MKSLLLSLAFGVLATFSLPHSLPAQDDSSSEVHKLQWPRTFQDGDTTLMLYQPDIEKWDGNSFQARQAVSVQAKGQQSPTFGVIWVTARTDVDKDAGIVTLSDIQITKSSFPTEPDKAAAYEAAIKKRIPAKPLLLPLAQIDNRYLLSNAVKTGDAQPVKNTPPVILFSTKPAVLLIISGDPVFRPVGQTGYQRVFNTQALILQSTQGGPIYAKALGYWYKADPNFKDGIGGPWAPTPQVPKEVAAAGQQLIDAKQVDPINPPDGQPKPDPAPDVYVSMVPAELVQTAGQPQFVPIPDTNLLEVSNSANAIILDVDNQSYYVLISGRWFNAKTTNGPWAYVDGKSLPADFAKIPPDSDKANVLVSVPGTPQAEEAVIANSIPQTATVKRSEAKLAVNYDGQPQFSPIQDTPLQYAVNTPVPVIEVSPQSFYAVANGVWFTAPAPAGPWVVATSVPPVIYTIPVSSSLHYVTYVRVYGYTPDVVYVGYTPGYYGTVVTPDGTVVYGTGYAYPTYIGSTVYVAPPATYGYGAGFADGSATGFAFGFIAGVAVGALLEPNWGCWGYGWHGGWGNTYNVNINNGNIYNHWGNTAVVNHYQGWNGNHYTNASRGAAFNPYTGNWGAARGGSTYNPATGRGFSGNTTASGNAYTGNWNANQNRSYNNDQNGAHGQSHTTASGNAYNGTYNSTTTRSGETGNGTKAAGVTTNNNGDKNHTGAAYNPNSGKGAVWHDGNVYTGNDGNVYRRSDNGNWQSYNKSGWQNTQRTDANKSQFQSLDRQSQGWHQGNQNFQNRGAGGYGGRGGGGGGRR